jgi:ABC-type nitrate/sulfonate/bicarbonate transport system substrate-binding protein
MAQKEGFRLIVDLTRLDVPYLRTVIAASEKFLLQDAATASRFVEAVSEGMILKSSEQRRKHQILAKYLRVSDKNRQWLGKVANLPAT